MLYGRDKEIKELDEIYHSDKSEFVAVYGRRRVGKTFLINSLFGDKMVFFHAGLSNLKSKNSSTKRSSQNKEQMKIQLQAFHNSLMRESGEKTKAPANWLEAFLKLEMFLETKDQGQRMVIFLDELPWMDTPGSNFIQALESFWNEWASHKVNIMLIVCGSSTSWILNKLINSHGGLYDRITHEIHLLPFSLSETEKMLNGKEIHYSRYDIAQTYMILGGIPYYLDQLDNSLSLAQNVDCLFFHKNAKFKYEYERLFNSVFDYPEQTKNIVEFLNSRSYGYKRSEIIFKLGIKDGSRFSSYMIALVESDMVLRYFPFGFDRREPYYKLVDPFCLFYLRFVKNNTSLNNHFFEQRILDSSVTIWKGLSFENVCFNHINQIKNALRIGAVKTEESGFFKKGDKENAGTQVDLIIRRADNIVDLCECKFYSDTYAMNKDAHLSLVSKENEVGKHLKRRE